MDAWKIGPPAKACWACAKGFAPGESILSAVVRTAAGVARRDQCLSCSAPSVAEVLSYWRTATPRPPEGPPKADPAEVAEFFLRLVSCPEREERAAKLLYLVTLWLLRKRRLKLVERTFGAHPALRVERSWDGEVTDVPEVPIPEEEIEPLVGELERVFG